MRLTKENDGTGSWTQFGDKYLPAHNVKHKECVNKLGQLEDVLERHKVQSADDLDKKLKALKIIKENPILALVDYKYTYEEWLELVDERAKDAFKNKEEYNLLKEVLL